MTNKLMIWGRAAVAMSPVQVFTRALAKIGFSSRWTRRIDLLNDSQIDRPLKAISIIESQLLQLGSAAESVWTHSRDRRVLEIGCGAHGGLGPGLVCAGVGSYVGIDPRMDPELLRHPVVRTSWLNKALEACGQHFGRSPISVTNFEKRVNYVGTTLQDCDRGLSPVDLFVSVSCLEHIKDLTASLESTSRLSSPDASHFHIVNFSNHTDKRKPFAGLYEMELEAYLASWSGHINGLRPSDLISMFAENGQEVAFYPLDIRPDALPARLHLSWTDRYSVDELAVRVGLLISRRLVDQFAIKPKAFGDQL